MTSVSCLEVHLATKGTLVNMQTPRDYTFIAPMYDHIFNRPLSEGHQKMGTLMTKSRMKSRVIKILEVGVGSGLTLDHVPPRVEFTGIDVNEKMLTRAHKKASRLKNRSVKLRQMNAEKLKFTTSSFDLVLAPSVLSAMEQPMKAVKEMIRVTRKGGKIAIIVNLKQEGSLKSEMMKVLDPLTRKLLGFRLDLKLDDLQKFKGIKLIEKKEVNNLLGQKLSTYLLFEKT